MVHLIQKILSSLLLLTLIAFSSTVDISDKEKYSILEKSMIYIDQNNNLTLTDLRKNNLFHSYSKREINTGVQDVTIWIKIKLQNSSDLSVDRRLILTSPLLEEIKLYNSTNLNKPLVGGVRYITQSRITLYPSFIISLDPKSDKEYFIKIKSYWTPVSFKIFLDNEKSFQKENLEQQIVKAMLLAMIIILMIYSLILWIYTKDKSYLYYSLYLLTLVYQQSSYLGISQLYLPVDFITHIEIKMANTKVALMIISSSLFAIHFLKTKEIPIVNYIYKVFIALALLEITILNIPLFYNLKITILTSAVLIVFNLIASILSYQKGNQQARLFILGFGIVFLSYVILMADALGLTSVVQHFPNTLILGTTIEALILSLAFVDRYRILQIQKEEADKNREKIIKNKVTLKTSQLNRVLKAKDLLLKEVHHRVKNNLQIILSMIRLQSDKISNIVEKEKFTNIENRINAIAKTYNMLIIDEDLDRIDMEEYIESLLLDIEESMLFKESNIILETQISALLPLQKAVYIGIIINELVTNSYKYAFDGKKGKIRINLYRKRESYILSISDNGKGFPYHQKQNSLGLKLIRTLILEQLKGKLNINTENATYYEIEFE